MKQPTLFDGDRMNWEAALEVTAQSLKAYAESYKHWVIAYSGGKDSTATLAAVVHLIESGQIPRPESLTILLSDTRMELPPLYAAALTTLRKLRDRGFDARVVMPAMDDRFYVYMLGRGVPPPSNTFRWCTAQLKIEPMLAAVEDVAINAGYGTREWNEKKQRFYYVGNGSGKLLMLTGVRVGESAVRDARIALSCGKNGAECGQGWFQETTPVALADTLAPILHWRVCNVWDFLFFHAPRLTGLPTNLVAEAYGGDEAEEVNARTGCMGCNLASQDFALQGVIQNEKWAHLAPVLELRALYADLKRAEHRIRKDGSETRSDGTLVSNPCRMGPLTFEARRMGLDRVKSIQARARVDLINQEEEARIIELIEAGTWPRGWDGSEPLASLPFDNVNPDGSVQPIMMALMQ